MCNSVFVILEMFLKTVTNCGLIKSHFNILVQNFASHCLHICHFTSSGYYVSLTQWCALLPYYIITIQQDRLECALLKKKNLLEELLSLKLIKVTNCAMT